MLAWVTSKPTLHIHHEPEFHTLQIIVPFDISESRGKTCIPSVSSWWLFSRKPKEKKIWRCFRDKKTQVLWQSSRAELTPPHLREPKLAYSTSLFPGHHVQGLPVCYGFHWIHPSLLPWVVKTCLLGHHCELWQKHDSTVARLSLPEYEPQPLHLPGGLWAQVYPPEIYMLKPSPPVPQNMGVFEIEPWKRWQVKMRKEDGPDSNLTGVLIRRGD